MFCPSLLMIAALIYMLHVVLVEQGQGPDYSILPLQDLRTFRLRHLPRLPGLPVKTMRFSIMSINGSTG
jgi:hypothetical protein